MAAQADIRQIPHHIAWTLKSRPVDIGLYALANGPMQRVQALTTMLQRRGLRHA
jgi:hypothetical protein